MILVCPNAQNGTNAQHNSVSPCTSKMAFEALPMGVYWQDHEDQGCSCT